MMSFELGGAASAEPVAMAAAGEAVAEGGRHRTEYEQVLWNMQHDPRWLQEAGLGKRVGFYRFLENIGSGNFSHVKKALHQLTRDRVAVKIIDKTKLDAKTRKMIDQEIKTMEAVHHPNIIRLFEVMDTYRKIYLVMEYAPGGELYTRVSVRGPCGEVEARMLFLQVAQAVRHMHRLGYVHRDIKPENVFYFGARNLVKLGDFGFSTRLPDNDASQKLNTFCGSPPYAAPELFRDARYAGPPVDVWALGVLLYFLLTAATPFRAPTLYQLKSCILGGAFHLPPALSPHCRDIIQNTLVQNVAERFSVHEIVEHEWFRPPPPPAPPSRPRRHSLTFLANKFRRERTRSTDAAAEGAAAAEEAAAEAAAAEERLGRRVMFPTASERLAELDAVERRARLALQRHGITSRMLLEARELGARSPVLGAYRSAVGMLLGERCHVWEAAPPAAAPAPAPAPPHLVAVGTKGKQCFRAKLARACVVL